MPQLVENYKSKSAEGISLAFLTVWFIGDIANVLGALWAGLVPTVIALAVYFCFADLILITQCLYYNFLNTRKGTGKHSAAASESEGEERQALLGCRNSDNVGLPGSRRRSSASPHQGNSQRSHSGGRSVPSTPEWYAAVREWLKNGVGIFLVCAAGTAAWAIAWRAGLWRPTPSEDDDSNSGDTPKVLGAQMLGYLSALAYLGSVQLPCVSFKILHFADIIIVIVLGYLRSSKTTVKDRAKVSKQAQRCGACGVEIISEAFRGVGLSLLFFILSLLGNATYGGGVRGI